MWLLAYVAARLDAVSSSADHLRGGQGAPPVSLGAGGVAHHGEQGLLEEVCRGAAGWWGGGGGGGGGGEAINQKKRPSVSLFLTMHLCNTSFFPPLMDNVSTDCLTHHYGGSLHSRHSSFETVLAKLSLHNSRFHPTCSEPTSHIRH